MMEKMEMEQLIKKPEVKLSDKENEMIGRELADIDPKMARTYLKISNMSDEDINMVLSSAGKNPEKKGLGDEEKKEFYRKMAEEEEENAKRSKGENKKFHEENAKTYRRESERLER